MKKAKVHPFVAEEARIAEQSLGLNAKCGACGNVPSHRCREHFVARIEELEGHRSQWRRIAFNLYDLILRGDWAQASERAREAIEGIEKAAPSEGEAPRG